MAKLARALGPWAAAVAGFALIYLAMSGDPELAPLAYVGLGLLLVDLVVTLRNTVRMPGYGWPFVAFVVIVAGLSLLVRS